VSTTTSQTRRYGEDELLDIELDEDTFTELELLDVELDEDTLTELELLDLSEKELPL
jgi:hypothetical protein